MRRPFRKSLPPMSPAARERQGRIVLSATAALADLDAVRSFLNSHHPGLRGRPLDLAVASDAGLAAVETAIAAEARIRTGAGRLPDDCAAAAALPQSHRPETAR